MMDAEAVVKALREGYGSIAAGKFSEAELPEAVRLIANKTWSAAWSEGMEDGRYEAQQVVNDSFD